MLNLITDRTQRNVSYRATLAQKGWRGMTEAEQKEWLGDPIDTEGANLIPYGPYYSSVVNMKYESNSITATATADGVYLYAVSIIGEAHKYADKIFTLSVESMDITGGGSPQIAAYWHDDTGFEYAGASIFTEGSVTFNTADFPNLRGRSYLALYVYVTTATEVTAGASVKFNGIMMERGNVRHPHAPYTEVIPTEATKGAYNYSDLNRVERAVAEISTAVGLNLTTRTTWTMWDLPKSSDMARYLSNIESIRAYFSIDIQAPTSMSNLTYVGANNIELILQAAYYAITE